MKKLLTATVLLLSFTASSTELPVEIKENLGSYYKLCSNKELSKEKSINCSKYISLVIKRSYVMGLIEGMERGNKERTSSK